MLSSSFTLLDVCVFFNEYIVLKACFQIDNFARKDLKSEFMGTISGTLCTNAERVGHSFDCDGLPNVSIRICYTNAEASSYVENNE